MKLFLCFLLFSSLLPLFICYHYSNLSYQAHGFNDLDYFLQQLVKGTNYFKVDVSQATFSSCTAHSTWNYENECEYLDYFNICCLGFRGDTGSEPFLNEGFNTTYDFLRLLNNSKYDFIWKKETQLLQYNYTKYIAINFQYDHPLSSMTKYFLYELLFIINTRNLNIQIITGSNSFIDEYENKCINSCDFMEKYIAESNVMFQSTSYNPGEQRSKNFNLDYTAIESYCNNGFPDWPDNYSIPYFFWEPSSEDSIKYVLNTFKNESCKKSELHKNINEIKITSNLEPEMIEIYSKDFNNTEDILKILLEGVKQAHIEFDEASGMILFTQVLNENQTLFQVFSVDQQNSTLKQEFSQTLNFYSIKFDRKDKYIMFFSKEFSFLYFFSIEYEIILSLVEFVENSNSLLSSLFLIKEQLPLIFSLYRTDNISEIEINLFDIYGNLSISKQILQLPNDTTIENIENIDLASENSLSISDEIIQVIVVYSRKVLPQNVNGLFGVIIEIYEGLNISVVVTSDSPYDFGNFPSIKIGSVGGEMMILEVHTDGLCQCGVMMNNNEFDKCHYHLNENHYLLLNSPSMMNYIWGKYSDFKLRLIQGKAINGCDEKLMHSKFNNGKNPKAAIFNFNNKTQALIANEFVSYDDLPLTTRFLCGGNQRDVIMTQNKTKNTVIQSFSLTDAKIFSMLEK